MSAKLILKKHGENSAHGKYPDNFDYPILVVDKGEDRLEFLITTVKRDRYVQADAEHISVQEKDSEKENPDP